MRRRFDRSKEIVLPFRQAKQKIAGMKAVIVSIA